MKKEYGSALKEFLKGRDFSNASPDLKKLYSESKSWDSFLIEAKSYGFKWSQIYFAKELIDRYSCKNIEHLKWLILHVLYQYEVGNLRSSISNIQSSILEWVTTESSPFNIEKFILDVPNVIKNNTELFGVGSEPFLLEDDYIYINRIKKYESKFLELLNLRLNTQNSINYDVEKVSRLLAIDNDRLEIVEKALKSNFLIISGGPGTGKTTTIVTLIKTFKALGLNNISLAAPTGRAAKRMVESITEELDVEAFTLHKLLGIIPNRDKPKYHGGRFLPADVVIIDEASMVDIHMMYRLFDALNPHTKLILVGDKDQLPSVEAGALLGDFLYNSQDKKHKMNNSICLLEKSYRSTKGIMDVAKVVISGESEKTLELMKQSGGEVSLYDIQDIDMTISMLIKKYTSETLSPAFKISVTLYSLVISQIESYFELFSSFSVLTPSKKGLFGTYSLNSRLKKLYNPNYSRFYHGEPIMITKNDYINGLYNGDRGVVFSFNDGLYVFFKEVGGFKVVSISKLSDYETSYVGTVHKSQGSEFESVVIIIPEGSERMLTREILYTALTRAKKKVEIYSMDNEIKIAVSRKIKRESGIRDFLID